MRKPILVSLAALFITIISFSPCSAQVATGQYASGTFDNKGLDTINIGNLNVHLNIPVLNKSGRGMPFWYNLSYDSSVWYPTSVSGSKVWVPVQSFGWKADTNVVTGYVTYHSTNSDHYVMDTTTQQLVFCEEMTYGGFVYHDPFGIQHGFAGTTHDWYNDPPICNPQPTPSFTAQAFDGSGYTLSVSDYTYTLLTSASGKNISPAGTGAGTITDSNGNQITLSSSGQFTDTTGNVALSVSGTAPNPTTLTYTDTSGNPQTVTVAYQTYTVQTAFGCSGIGEYGPTTTSLVDSIAFPDGSSYHFTYEVTTGYLPADKVVTGRLASVTTPQGGVISYTYSGGSNGINCADGSTATLTRIISSVDGSAASTWTYASTPGSGTSETLVTDGSGNQSVFDFVETNNAYLAAEYYETRRKIYQGADSGTPLLDRQSCYNGASLPCTTTRFYSPISQVDTYESLNGSQDRGSTVKYNSYGLKTEEDDYDFGDPSQRTLLRKELWTYPSFGIVNLLESDIVEDGSGNRIKETTYGYDATTPQQSSGVPQHVAVSGQRGNLTSVTKFAATGETYTTTYTYEDTGSVLTSTSPTTASGATTTYTYDPTFVYNTGVQLPTPSSGVALSSSQTYDQANTGFPKVSTDVNGQQTKVISYDSMLRPTEIDYPDGGSSTVFYSSSHNQIGLYRAINASTSTNTQTLYDGYGRLSRTAVYLGSTINQWYQQDTCYDADGRISFTSYQYQGNGWGTPKVCSGAGDAYSYDALGRLKTVTHGDGTSIQYTYLARATETTDENLVSRIVQVDGLGRTTAVCEISSTTYEGDSPSNCNMDLPGTGFLTTYAYANRQTTITQGAQTRIFHSDWLGRPTSVQEPELQQAGQPPVETTYSYLAPNATGPIVTRTRPKANQTNPTITTTTTTQYDALGRVVSISYNDGTPEKDFFYDQATAWGGSTLSLGDSKGRLTSETRSVDGNWTGGTFGYDSMGRVTMMLECVPSRCGKGSQYDKYVNYTYDWLGDVLTATDGAGVTTSYTYTPAQEVEKITSSLSDVTHPGALVTNVQYGPFGPLNWQLGNGLYGVRSYDALGRNNGGWVCSGTTQTFCNGGGTIYGYTDAWKGAQSTQICDTVLNRCSQYSYDDLNRVASQTGTAPNFTYVYDRYGNRWQQNVTAGSGPSPQLTFDKTTNRINSGNYQYDAAGNLINDGFHTYTYDAEGNVTAVDGGATATYTYNALNERVQVASGGGGQEYAFSLNGQRVSSWDVNTGNQIQGQVYWGSAPIELYQNGAAHFQHLDGQSTERAVTSYNGSVEGTFTSLPFGDGYSASGSDSDPYHFAMLDKDYYGSTDSGTDHAKFRLYSDTQGRWMSPDPYSGSYDVNNPQSMNRYSYVLNNPLAYVDPAGLERIRIGPCVFEVEANRTTWTYNGQPDGSVDDLNYWLIGCDDNDGNFNAYTVDNSGRGPGVQPPAPRINCFTPNWLQQKGIAVEHKVAQFFGHPFGFGAGFSGGVGLGKGLGFAITASAQMIVNPNGNAFLLYTFGGSGLTTPWLSLQSKGAGVVGGFQGSLMTATNATLSDLQGYAVDGSAGGGDGLGLAGDVNYSGGFQGTVTVGGAAGGWGQAGVITKSVAIPSCSNHP